MAHASHGALLTQWSRTFAALLIVALTLIMTTPLRAQHDDGRGFDMGELRRALAVDADTGTSGGAAQPRTSSGHASSNPLIAGIRLVGYLALTLGGIAGLAWCVKRWTPGAARRRVGGTMDIVESLPVGQGRMVTMVRLRDTVYLIGQTPHQITLLDKLDPEEAETVLASAHGENAVGQFKDVLGGFLSRFTSRRMDDDLRDASTQQSRD